MTTCTTKFIEHFDGVGTYSDERLRLTIQVVSDDDDPDDLDYVVKCSPHIGHLNVGFGMDRVTATALRDHLTAALDATTVEPCEVCEGRRQVLDPNHGDIPIGCPECRTALHIAQLEARQAVSA